MSKKLGKYCFFVFVLSLSFLLASCSYEGRVEQTTKLPKTSASSERSTEGSSESETATEQTLEFTSGTGTVVMPETEKNYAKVLQNANDFVFVCYKCDSNGVRIAVEDSYSFFESEDITDAWYFKTLFSPSNAIEEEPYPFDSWWRVTTYSLVLELSTSEGEVLEFKFCYDYTENADGNMNLRNTVYCDFENEQSVERYVFELSDEQLLPFEKLFTFVHGEQAEIAE